MPSRAAGSRVIRGARGIGISSSTQAYGSGNVVDGNANTYWESANNAFPQWVQVDLGASVSVGRVTLRLPPSTAWTTRTQTVTVTDGATGATLRGSITVTFDPASGNTAILSFPTANVRYLRLVFTANSGWPAGQLSEFEAYSL